VTVDKLYCDCGVYVLNEDVGLCSESSKNKHMHAHTYIPWIHKFLIATIGCGTSHKDTKPTDKYDDNQTTQKQNNKTQRYICILCLLLLLCT
jgi:hypothetical protein